MHLVCTLVAGSGCCLVGQLGQEAHHLRLPHQLAVAGRAMRWEHELASHPIPSRRRIQFTNPVLRTKHPYSAINEGMDVLDKPPLFFVFSFCSLQRRRRLGLRSIHHMCVLLQGETVSAHGPRRPFPALSLVRSTGGYGYKSPDLPFHPRAVAGGVGCQNVSNRQTSQLCFWRWLEACALRLALFRPKKLVEKAAHIMPTWAFTVISANGFQLFFHGAALPVPVSPA